MLDLQSPPKKHGRIASLGHALSPVKGSPPHTPSADKENKAVAASGTSDLKIINFQSLILANGLTNPKIQMGAVADYACDGPYPVYDDPEGAQCQALRSRIPTCQRLMQSCYDFDSRFTCVPAGLYCNAQLFGPLMRKYS